MTQRKIQHSLTLIHIYLGDEFIYFDNDVIFHHDNCRYHDDRTRVLWLRRLRFRFSHVTMGVHILLHTFRLLLHYKNKDTLLFYIICLKEYSSLHFLVSRIFKEIKEMRNKIKHNEILTSVKMVNFVTNLSKIDRVTVNRDEPLKRRTSLNFKKNSFSLEHRICML